MRTSWTLSLLATLILFMAQSHAAGVSGKALKEGDVLIVDAKSGLTLRPRPNSGTLLVIPDSTEIVATGEAQLHLTGRRKPTMKYWAPVKYINENNEEVDGWILLKHADLSPNQVQTPSSVPDISTPSAPAIREGGSNGGALFLFGTTTNDVSGETHLTVEQEALEEPEPELPTKPAPMPTAGPMFLKIKTNLGARFRSGPSRANQRLGAFANNTKVRIIGQPKGEWIPVKREDSEETGWVHISLLESQGELNPLEMAKLHSNSADDADQIIDEYAESVKTEAGLCTGNCPDEGGGLGKILVDGDDHEFIFPVVGNFRLSSRFGNRKDPFTGETKYHGGEDIAAPAGTPVVASRAGKVVAYNTGCKVGNLTCGRDRENNWGSGYGNWVKIRHDDGTETFYAHLKGVNVTLGDTVAQGQQIGTVGSTGRSTGNHLHFEVIKRGQKLNPANFVGHSH